MKNKSFIFYLVFIVGITAILISAVSFISNRILTVYADSQIESKMNQFQTIIEINKNSAINGLVQSCQFMATSKELMLYLDNEDSVAINSFVNSKKNIYRSDFSIITNQNNEIISKTENLETIDLESEISELFALLSGQYFVRTNIILNLWKIGEDYYVVCSMAVKTNDSFKGIVNNGILVKHLFTKTYSENINYALMVGTKVIYSQHLYNDQTLSDFIIAHHPIVDAILSTSASSDLFSTIMEGDQVLSKLIPLGFRLPSFFLLTVPKTSDYQILNTLLSYIVYVLGFTGFLILLISYFFSHRLNKQNSEIKQKMEKMIKYDPGSDSEFEEDIKIISTIKKGTEQIYGTILQSRILQSNSDIEIDINKKIEIFDNYFKLQIEVLELYGARIENIQNNQIMAFFEGDESTLDNAVRSAEAIIKLIKKEKTFDLFQVGIGIHFGEIFYRNGKNAALIGDAMDLLEGIATIIRPGQILLKRDLVDKISQQCNIEETKNWKLKNMESEIQLSSIGFNNK